VGHGITDSDMQFTCPICGATLKQADADPHQATRSDLVPYGCANCGYNATFVRAFLDDYIERRSRKE